MFNMKPVGKCILEVCHTGPCAILGADELIHHLENKLNIRAGETTVDGMFTIKRVECLGSCGTAPMLQCGADYYENLTFEKADALVAKLATEGKQKAYTDQN
jgi:NADH-quinone oxidoreductase subunit E